jgi:nucleoid-associated protein YgaU
MSIRPLGSPAKPAIEVMFNPNTYTISKSVTWATAGAGSSAGQTTDRTANAPTTTFGGGGNRQLTLELFFDVTEQPGKDVREETDRIVALTLMEPSTQRPPVCEVQWGIRKTLDFPFTGTVSSLTQRFTLFRSSGEPLRAVLNVTFMEFLDREKDLKKTDPEMTTRTVRRGDSLTSIAAEVYRNPALWRVVAEANRIDDPLRLAAGTKLSIPKL